MLIRIGSAAGMLGRRSSAHPRHPILGSLLNVRSASLALMAISSLGTADFTNCSISTQRHAADRIVGSLDQRMVASSYSGARTRRGPIRKLPSGTVVSLLSFFSEGKEEEADMPVLIYWAIPAVIIVGGVSYYLIRVVH